MIKTGLRAGFLMENGKWKIENKDMSQAPNLLPGRGVIGSFCADTINDHFSYLWQIRQNEPTNLVDKSSCVSDFAVI